MLWDQLNALQTTQEEKKKKASTQHNRWHLGLYSNVPPLTKKKKKKKRAQSFDVQRQVFS